MVTIDVRTIFAGLYLLRQTSGIVGLVASAQFLRRDDIEADAPPFPGHSVSAVIPVLDEQDLVTACVAHFVALCREGLFDEVLVITTDRDARRPTTGQVLQLFLDRHKNLRTFVSELHYSGPHRKAGQVNYAAEHLAKHGSWADSRRYLAVYDVDSRPTADSVRALHVPLRRRVAPFAVQQSAVFVPESAARAPSLTSRGAAALQTLWSLRREIPSFLRVAASQDLHIPSRAVRVFTRGLAQTVGHGLVVDARELSRMGGFPVDTAIEDLPFGYVCTVTDLDVRAARSMTSATVPSSTRTWLRQGARWFSAYPDYARMAARTKAPRVRRLYALAVAWYRGLTWLGRSPATIAASVLAVAPSTRAGPRVLAIAGLTVGFPIPCALVKRTRVVPELDPVALYWATCLSSVSALWGMVQSSQALGDHTPKGGAS